MIRMVRELIPPRFLPAARGIYSRGQRFRKLVTDWVVPPGLVRVKQRIDFEWCLRLTVYESTILSRNAKFRNMYAGRRCFVIGNSPSLNKQDLTPLANEITIVMNQFNKHPIINEWKPTFYCTAEPRENIKPEEILPVFLQGIDAQAYFFRIEYKEIFDKHRFADPDKVYYLKSGPPLYDWPVGSRRIDLTGTSPGCLTTAHMAIMMALHIGCSPIYLIGLDHDYLAHPFHGWAHFYPGPFDEIVHEKYNYRAQVEWVLNTWRGYEVLRDAATQKGIAIYNATAGGFLDVFERVNYEDVVGK